MQLYTIVQQHFTAVERYLTPPDDTNENLVGVLGWLEQLAQLCDQSPRHATYSDYLRTSLLLHRLNDFLELMNEDRSGRFTRSEVGRIWMQARQWCHEASGLFQPLARDRVWDWIAPAMPDTLDELENNVFEAKWAAPVPDMDVELLRGAEGIHVLGDAFEPAQMPDGLGLRFTIDS